MIDESGVVPRADQGDAFALVTPENPKIGIDCHYGVFWVQFAHPDQAKIGEIRLTIVVAPGEFFDLMKILLQTESKP